MGDRAALQDALNQFFDHVCMGCMTQCALSHPAQSEDTLELMIRIIITYLRRVPLLERIRALQKGMWSVWCVHHVSQSILTSLANLISPQPMIPCAR